MVQLKLRVASGNTPADKLQPEITDRRIDGAQHLVVMKKLNRMDKIRLRGGRDALHKEKLAVDSNHLQLQNLLYEADHLRKEVQRCFQFKSEDENIALVPEEQFYAEAPASIARAEVTRTDEHARRLARLEWELQQRKQLAIMCTELQRQKELAAEQIASKTERLESLAPRLDALLRATRPLQEALCMPVEDTWKVNRVARLLPAPLYMAYVNLSAYAEACDVLLVARINGDESDVLDDIDDDDGLDDVVAHDDEDDDEDVNSGLNTPKNVSRGRGGLNDDDAMESDGEERRVRHHHHHHHNHRNQQHADANAAMQPTANQQSAASAPNGIAKASTDEVQLERLLRAHPLSVSFEVRTRGKTAVLCVTLRYLTALNLVTVTCSTSGLPAPAQSTDDPILSAGSLLTALTAGDTGAESPNPKTFYQLNGLHVAPERFAALLVAKKLGRPYRWAQQLCGLDFASSAGAVDGMELAVAGAGGGGGNVVAQLEVTQAAVPSVVRQIRQRWQTRLRLCEQIRALCASAVSVPLLATPSTAAAQSNATAAAAVLLRWLPMDWSEYQAQASAQRFVQAGRTVVDENDLFYGVSVARGEIARFECAVRVSVRHPRTLPLWALTFHARDSTPTTAQTNAVVRVSER